MGKILWGKCPKCHAAVYADKNQQIIKCEVCGTNIPNASAVDKSMEAKSIASNALTFILVALAFIIGTSAFMFARILHNVRVKRANETAIISEIKTDESSDNTDTAKDTGREEVEHLGPEFDSDAHYISDDQLTDHEWQAIDDAKFFLGTTFYSKYELMCQLAATADPEYTQDEAQVAIEYLEAHDLVDWNHECAEAAQLYLDIYDGYTKDELKSALTNKVLRFSDEQADYALAKMGYK
ncbi:hypothetical protein [Butyrivibrio sp. WCE2006]|uniref:hypothetical protein n=1 Tax=Butyrivibrio sp. WCE2006 TaxID=1410611 RepID=UPI0005D28290|nr:hypothetical protein [Butyrivibrio sp. WCE2006]